MKFKLKPILSEMKELYSKPISAERFKEYISKLQGDTKGDLALPIGGFNPMAKNHILQKISELENLRAEAIMEQTIKNFNTKLVESSSKEITVVLNIADDLKGGWTNFFSTDFDSKFKLTPLINRSFCVPYFWTSELFSTELITNRTLEYLNRTFYRLKNPQPKTLREHLKQEIFSLKLENNYFQDYIESDFIKIEKYYSENKNSEEYDRIFNFFYGDKGSESLGYKKYGIQKPTGYEYAKQISKIRKITI
ncbi:hypothetical protein [uncultured Tenacibaculum sp.]|uniref:hypothetical protein n=2 Tax=uncultured Tenacibaculum sp. TaxID=174713 RepID=UPI002625BB0C|nr:hypothetical protein [uncultured Tenacibaculum sp.]